MQLYHILGYSDTIFRTMLLIPADYIFIFNGAIIESANPQDLYFHPHGYFDFLLLLSIYFAFSIIF